MGRSLISALLVTVITTHLMRSIVCPSYRCGWTGFGGCECNIAGACDMHGNPITTDPKLTNYAPSGLERMAEAIGENRNLAYLCEGGVVAIMYDCNSRIPLYAATVMTGDQLQGGTVERAPGFKRSNDRALDPYYQQQDRDYERSSHHEICFETKSGKRYLDHRWYKALNVYKPEPKAFTECDQILDPREKKVAIHKGHLIAARYGRGIPGRGKETFTYTNVVPQFANFNSGQWNFHEGGLEKWGKKYCLKYKGLDTINVRMYIIVGIIPSIRPDPYQRYFGQKGFSDFQDDSNYRVNVPSTMWTVACCIFQYQGNAGRVEGAKHTAFSRENNPSNQECDKPADMHRYFQEKTMSWDVYLFPAKPKCSDPDNYVSILA